MTRRAKSRQIRQQVGAKSEARRVRRGRQESTQSGQGHGKRAYVKVTARAERKQQSRDVGSWIDRGVREFLTGREA